MSATSVLRHTTEELLTILGQVKQTGGLHVYIQEGPPPEIPVLHPHRMEDPLFFLLLDGELQIKINLVDHFLAKDDFIFISPHAIRQFIKISPELKIACFCFTTEFILQSGMTKGPVDPSAFLSAKLSPRIRLQPEEAQMIVELMNIVYLKNTAVETSPFRRERLIHSFSLLLYEIAALFNLQLQAVPLKLSRKEEIGARFLNVLPLHFKEQRSLQFYADQLFITPKYLTQTIKEVVGKTAGELIDEMVIMEAKVLLHTTSLSIAQVAESLYFSDQFFFSKFFKNQTGITPSEYRKA
jgi:AraC-like DNA-binding protein